MEPTESNQLRMSKVTIPVRLLSRQLAVKPITPTMISIKSYSTRPTPVPVPTNLPGSNLPGASKYSPITVSIVTNLAKLFGYNSQTSTAIRTASDYYDRCAERGEIEAPFFYEGKNILIFQI